MSRKSEWISILFVWTRSEIINVAVTMHSLAKVMIQILQTVIISALIYKGICFENLSYCSWHQNAQLGNFRF